MKHTNRMVQKTVGIPIYALERLEQYAEINSISVADAIRMALAEFLNKHHQTN